MFSWGALPGTLYSPNVNYLVPWPNCRGASAFNRRSLGARPPPEFFIRLLEHCMRISNRSVTQQIIPITFSSESLLPSFCVSSCSGLPWPIGHPLFSLPNLNLKIWNYLYSSHSILFIPNKFSNSVCCSAKDVLQVHTACCPQCCSRSSPVYYPLGCFSYPLN